MSALNATKPNRGNASFFRYNVRRIQKNGESFSTVGSHVFSNGKNGNPFNPGIKRFFLSVTKCLAPPLKAWQII